MEALSRIELSAITKKFKNQTVLDSISLSISEPGIWALVAPNGAGKTTLLNIIANLLKPTSGKVTLLGKSNADHRIFKEVSFLQDNSVLFDYLTGYDHLKYVCDVQKLPTKRIAETAAYVGMEGYLKKRVGQYSLGMKQHLLLAAAIISEPKILLMDEPLNGLDPTSAILVRKILTELAEKGTTIILSSHNLGEIDRVTQQILFLKNGELIQENTSSYEIVSYHFCMPHSPDWEARLTATGFAYDKVGDGYTIQLGNHPFQQLLDLSSAADLPIRDIQKVISGTEKRYSELFGVQGTV